jgi:hypothetical protein
MRTSCAIQTVEFEFRAGYLSPRAVNVSQLPVVLLSLAVLRHCTFFGGTQQVSF